MKEVPPNRLRDLRLSAGLTQTEVGMLLGGVSKHVVSHHEVGERGMSHEAILKYARIFKVYTYELFVEPIRKDHDQWQDYKKAPVELEHEAADALVPA